MTIEEIKDQVAQEHGYSNFDTAMILLCSPKGDYYLFNKIISKAMHRLAEIVAIEQIDNYNGKIFGSMIYPEYRDDVYTIIQNAPLASDKYKP